jgi:hypothetical protein
MCARRVGQSPVASDACEAFAPPRLVRRALKSLPPTARDRLAVEERLACYEAANRLHNPRKPVSESAPRRLHTLTTAA